MHQRRAIGAKFVFGAVQPQHGIALALGDRFAPLPTIDIFPARIDRSRSALGFLPVALERPPRLILRLVDLAMGMQAREWIVADRTQSNDLLARLKRQRIIDLDGCDFGIAQQIARPPVLRLGGIVRLSAFGSGHMMASLKAVELGFGRKLYSVDASDISWRSKSDNSSLRPHCAGCSSIRAPR